jgi:hypothetical protein
MTPAEARAILRRRLENRSANLLDVFERFVFPHASSPYHQLLRVAGVQPGDVRGMLARDGVDTTLRRLRDAGVHIAFEEFKGTRPVERSGVVIEAGPQAFVNPGARAYYQTETGGSTGRGRHVQLDVDHLLARVPHRLVSDEIHGMLGIPSALWFETLPGNGPQSILQRAPYGAVPVRWFTPVLRGRGAPPWKHRIANRAIVEAARMSGIPFPRPEYVPLDRAEIVARWAAEMCATHGRAAVFTHPSKAVRVCLAARDLGLDLAGAVFAGGGEPVTQAKVDAIARAGARFVSGYIAMETGIIGMQCAHAVDPNEQHFFSDHLAVVQYPRRLDDFAVTVDTFYFTTLLPSATRLLINVELDDFGVITQRRCGCPFEALGYTDHIRDIRSFRKLTGEGMTLIGTEADRILGQDMPALCGGTALDYQLSEEEDELGLTRLILTVHPRVPSNDDAIRAALLDALSRTSIGAALAGTIWSQASGVRVRRAEPEWTGRGKLPLFLPLKRASRNRE